PASGRTLGGVCRFRAAGPHRRERHGERALPLGLLALELAPRPAFTSRLLALLGQLTAEVAGTFGHALGGGADPLLDLVAPHGRALLALPNLGGDDPGALDVLRGRPHPVALVPRLPIERRDEPHGARRDLGGVEVELERAALAR